tara:strand:- start:4055 stop:5032 length:978 start_codon:yes stop_codon:yes gene_type:complete
MTNKEYENTLINKLNEARPNNKESSHKQYVRCLKLLSKKNKEDDFNNIDFAKDRELVGNLTTDLSDSTKRNYLTACANILRLEEKNDDLDIIIKYYEDKVKEYNTQYKKDNSETSEISAKQKPAFDIGMEGLIDMMYKMERDVLKNPTTYLAYMVYQILLRHPLRNEIGTLEKITLSKFNKLKLNDELVKNYLVIPSNIYKKPLTIVSTNYKTDDKYGIKKVDIVDKTLRKKIMDYIKYTGNTNTGALFENNNVPVNEKSLTDILLYQSKKYTTDNIGIGTTMFAKITISHETAEIHSIMKEKAIARGHSIGIQSLTYIKTSSKE